MASSPSAAALCAALALLLVVSQLPVALPAPETEMEPQQAVGSTPTPPNCSADLVRLLPCLSFVGGSAAAPTDTCCANLGSMVHDEPQCLCQALTQSGSGAPHFAMNVSRVLELPPLCGLNLPPATGVAACAGFLPVGAPPSPPANPPRQNASSTVPSMQTPVVPTPPLTTVSPRTSSQLPGQSSGSKLSVDVISVALGAMALASALVL